jgi:hypothetical protein
MLHSILKAAAGLSILSGAVIASPVSLNSSYVEAGQTGAVASEAQECTRIGIDVLSKGGNAADAVSERVMNLKNQAETSLARCNPDMCRRDWNVSFWVNILTIVWCLGVLT